MPHYTWLDECGAQHAQINGSSSHDALYSSQIKFSELMLRCKARYAIQFNNHTGSVAHRYASSKGHYIFEDYLSSTTFYQLHKALSRPRCGSHWLKCTTHFTALDTKDHSCPACIEGHVNKIVEAEHHYILECDQYANSRKSTKIRLTFTGPGAQTSHESTPRYRVNLTS